MHNKCNKRTFKRRIRRVLSFCILMTILILSSISVLLNAFILHIESEAICMHFSINIANEINSPDFLKQMNIRDLKVFNKYSPESKKWLENLKNTLELEDKSSKGKLQPLSIITKPKSNSLYNKIFMRKFEDKPDGFSEYFSFLPKGSYNNIVYATIRLNGIEIFTNEKYDTDLPFVNNTNKNNGIIKFVNKIYNFYSRTVVDKELYSIKGQVIGKVSVRSNSVPFFVMLCVTVVFVIFISLILLLFAKIISRIITIPVVKPITQLDEKILALANNNLDSVFNSQIELKRPLKEIESLVNSTNLIMNRMKDYNGKISSQKFLLENQYDELEAQNEELIASKSQLEEAQSMLVQKENMASIGQLTAAINHEINTPLGAINSNVQICDMFIGMLEQNEKIQSDEELKTLVEQMKEATGTSLTACSRITEIIKSLRTFSKLDQAEFQYADINEGIRSTLVLTSNLWKRKIKIHEDYGTLLGLKCFPGLLNQVFMNILVNAIHSIEKEGDIYIRTYSDNQNIYISIRDTGIGIKPEHLPLIFEPGFTTRDSSVGMGLGLTICQNIINKHHGDITVSSELGAGSEFIVIIPLGNEQTSADV